jgi:hypothetical protein
MLVNHFSTAAAVVHRRHEHDAAQRWMRALLARAAAAVPLTAVD